MENLDFLLSRIYFLSKLPIRHIDTGECVILNCGFDKAADPVILDASIREKLRENSKALELPAIDIEEDKFLYGCCRLSSNEFIYVGPALIHNISDLELRQYKRKHNIPEKAEIHIDHCNIFTFLTVLSMIHSLLTGMYADEDDIIKANEKNLQLLLPNMGDYLDYVFENSELDIQRSTYANELAIRQMIVEGDAEALLNKVNYISFDRMGKLASSSFKQHEYMAVSGITFMTRAAIDGGVKPGVAYDTSDLYLQKLEKCRTVLEIIELIKAASISFASMVKTEKERKSESSYIEKCKSYIQRHIYRPFSLDDLAEFAGVNKNYLSSQFTRIEGMHISEFVHRARIEAACNMLRYSDKTISSIAENLCFHSQSHFGSVFKKYVHMTPQQYRNRMKVIDLQNETNILIKN